MSDVSVPGQSERDALLAFQIDSIVQMLMGSASDDPVGFIIDATDRGGENLPVS